MQMVNTPIPKLGKMLVSAKLITQGQLKMALEYQEAKDGKLGVILEDLGFITEDTLIKFIAKQQNLKIIDLEKIVLPEKLIKKIPRYLLEKHIFLPLSLEDDVLTIAISDPTDYEVMEDIQLVADWQIKTVLAPTYMIRRALFKIFYR